MGKVKRSPAPTSRKKERYKHFEWGRAEGSQGTSCTGVKISSTRRDKKGED